MLGHRGIGRPVDSDSAIPHRHAARLAAHREDGMSAGFDLIIAADTASRIVHLSGGESA
jgi:hypothetical protein